MNAARLYTLAADNDFSGPNHDIPVIAENVGPFASLADALAAWPGYHEATDAEYHAYSTYWEAVS